MACDIIIPVWNQLDATRACVDSIREYTKVPYKLIIVDNASDKPAADYLGSIRSNDISVIRNTENEGFIKAVNKGVLAGRSSYVCLLNNDTIVTDGWLAEMINVLSSDPAIGIVNPSSNNLGQNIPEGKSLEDYVKDIQINKGRYVALRNAVGFCMLVRRSLFEGIGLFDEVFGMGNFEDTDFSFRARAKGFNSVRALAAYVVHKESKSFSLLKHFKRDFEKNRETFEKRWGRPKRVLYVIIGKSLDDKTKDMLESDIKAGNAIFLAHCGAAELLPKDHHSAITEYVYRHFFKLMVLRKIVFGRKRFDNIHSDDLFFARLFRR